MDMLFYFSSAALDSILSYNYASHPFPCLSQEFCQEEAAADNWSWSRRPILTDYRWGRKMKKGG